MVDKVLIFAGAPESSALDWTSSALLTDFQDAIARFISRNTNSEVLLVTPPASEHAAWRSLPLQKANVPTGFSQTNGLSFNYVPAGSIPPGGAEFFTTASVSFTSSGDDEEQNSVLSQFYEHSMAAHQEMPSSQLVFESSAQMTSFISDDGTTSILSGDGTQEEYIRGPLLFRGSDRLTDLENIPRAAYLLKIQPQTVTCNLIVGVISISMPRMVKTRWGATRHLVEILVGDETKAGFAITFWLPSDSVADSPLAGLRPRDIVLLQNVALNVFANKVYGSSLRKNLTKVHLLHRVKLDPRDPGGYYSTSALASAANAHPQLEKTRRVRDWVLDFVGHGSNDRYQTNPKARWDRPPADDTQLA
ncbi:hypothetical protein VTK56DRAFT_2919 [Thermocarpiscus australiensis]